MVWDHLRSHVPTHLLDTIIQVQPLARVFELGQEILDGKTRGRVVIDVNA
jgi:hypothetical protein